MKDTAALCYYAVNGAASFYKQNEVPRGADLLLLLLLLPRVILFVRRGRRRSNVTINTSTSLYRWRCKSWMNAAQEVIVSIVVIRASVSTTTGYSASAMHDRLVLVKFVATFVTRRNDITDCAIGGGVAGASTTTPLSARRICGNSNRSKGGSIRCAKEEKVDIIIIIVVFFVFLNIAIVDFVFM